MRARAVVLAAAVLAASPAWARGRTILKMSGTLNLSTANAEQLALLPGVGPKSAKAIIDYRIKTPFGRVEELVRVKGFGRKRFLKLKPYLQLNGATTFQVQKLPGPDPKAQGRPAPP